MDLDIEQLSSTTFGGRRFTRKQLMRIRETTQAYPGLSRRELSHTFCEHFNWVTPKGKNRVQACLNALEEMASINLIILPAKVTANARGKKQPIVWTKYTDPQPTIDTALASLLPLRLVIVDQSAEVKLWNEYVDRHHYLGYRQPIGSHLRYFITDCRGNKLGCILFSFATRILPDRDQWIGWDKKARQKRLDRVINNNRYLIFPWVQVTNLASKALAMACKQLSVDWQEAHGYQPLLLETFVDRSQYKGTCYRAANWINIGQTAGSHTDKNGNKKSIKDIYLYPLATHCQEILSTGSAPPKTTSQLSSTTVAYEPGDAFILVWQKIIETLTTTCEHFDAAWRKRQRLIGTQLLVLFIFRLVFAKNKQGYASTINELWDQCRRIGIDLPQHKPPAASAFSAARSKLDETIFKSLNSAIIEDYTTPKSNTEWRGHRLFAVDGTRINLPRQLLQNGYKLPLSTAHYPCGLVSCLYQLRSKIPIDFDLKAATGERAQALAHLDKLSPLDIVIYDRGYFSYSMLYWHIKKSIHPIFRMPLQTYQVVADFMRSSKSDELVDIVLGREKFTKIKRKDPNVDIQKLTLRLVKYQIDDNSFTLGTTLYDKEMYPADELAKLYHERWDIEELYKISKVLIEVQDFHGQSERGVKQELYAHFVIITLSRIFSNYIEQDINAASDGGQHLETRVNMKNCLLTISRNLESLLLEHHRLLKKTLSTILASVANCRQKLRLNRSYQRRSRKPYGKWQRSSKIKDPITPSAQRT
ncbi:MAG: IS4 family transposase [Pseudomonadales bacterium]|nr:IS4 family transposase [Pseudomonadales bacterium]